MAEQKVTEDQATDALRQLLANSKGEQVAAAPVVAAPEPAEPVAEEPVAEAAEPATETVEQEAAPATETEPETDDVTSLRQRLADAEKARTEQDALFKARWDAMNERNQQNQRILNDRFLRKATVADRALKTLKGVRSEHGLPETDVDRVIQEIEASMNPASQSYTPLPPQPVAAEEQAIALNEFLNERGMTAPEAAEFGKWMQIEAPSVMTPGELDVARESVGGFLRLAHDRWQGSLRAKTNQRANAVEAVKVVQRVQKQASKAASAVPSAPRKTQVASAPKDTIDFKDVTPDMISEWARKSVEQYK